MQLHHINGVTSVNDKKGKPIRIENRETSNKGQIVDENQLFPIASLQKIMTGTALILSITSKKADKLEYFFG